MRMLIALEESDEYQLKGPVQLPPSMQLRQFRAFRFNDLYYSVQASAHHFCEPRETLTDPLDYRAMEMAMVWRGGEFTRVKNVLPRFARDTNIEGYYSEPIYSNVPVELLEDLYEELVERFGKGGQR